VAVLVVVTLVGTYGEAHANHPDLLASRAEASTVASRILQSEVGRDLPGWPALELGAPILYVGVDGLPVSYVMAVYHGDESAGHIVISAVKSTPALIHFGTWPAPHLVVACSEGCHDRFTMIHAGHLQFYARDEDGECLEICASLVRPVERLPRQSFRPNWHGRLHRDWTSSMSWIGSSGPIIDKPRLDVVVYNQWTDGVIGNASACGPTAGAMMMNYWATSLGWPELHPWTDDHEDGVELINTLRSEMGTTSLGTTITGFRNGLISWAESQYDNSVVTAYKKQTLWDGNEVIWDHLMSERNGGHPSGFYVGDPWRPVPPDEYVYHWMTATGYRYDSVNDVRLLRLNDSAGGTDVIDYNYYCENRSSLAMVGFNISD